MIPTRGSRLILPPHRTALTTSHLRADQLQLPPTSLHSRTSTPHLITNTRRLSSIATTRRKGQSTRLTTAALITARRLRSPRLPRATPIIPTTRARGKILISSPTTARATLAAITYQTTSASTSSTTTAHPSRGRRPTRATLCLTELPEI